MNVNSTTLTDVGNVGSGTSWSAGLVTAVAALLWYGATALGLRRFVAKRKQEGGVPTDF